MGKSPGKWLKSVLFGKKPSRSHSSKGKDASKTVGESKGPAAPDSPVISHPLAVNATRNETEIERVDSSIATKAAGISPANQDAGLVASAESSTPEKLREARAAIKAQAAFRGYLARRAFRALRGIIRLQALIRGHLVRRQAVATLRCMQAIVKLQALARGQKDAKKINSFKSVQKTKLSTNNFFCKLLSSKPVVLPLQMHYVLEEPNSAWNWLERWTFSQFWNPLPLPRRTMDHKSQRNGGYAMETESGKSKRTVRRNISTNAESGPSSTTIKQNFKKVLSTPAEPPAQEHPQSELEKVKRNLRKISNSTGKLSDHAEVETEKPRHGAKRASSLAMDVPAPDVFDSAEKTKRNNGSLPSDSKPDEEIYPKPAPILKPNITRDAESSAATELHIKATPQPSAEAKISVYDFPQHVEDKVDDGIVDDHLANLRSLNGFVKDKNHTSLNVEETPNEEQVCIENQKTSKRRASLSARPEYQEDGMQNTPTLPRYMQATDSAKAKLRGLSSPRFSSDGIDKNSFTRRHSLPSSTNGKLSSKKQVQTNGRSVKTDRSFGHDKPIQVEWRR